MGDLAGIPSAAVKGEGEEKILYDLRVELKPTSLIEEMVLERIAAAVVTLRRLDRAGGRVGLTEVYRDAEDSFYRSLRQLRLLRQSSLGRKLEVKHRKPEARAGRPNIAPAQSVGQVP